MKEFLNKNAGILTLILLILIIIDFIFGLVK